MTTNDGFDREIRELTLSYVRGNISKQEFDSRKKEVLKSQIKTPYGKTPQSTIQSDLPLKAKRRNGIILLFVLSIFVISTYAFIFFEQTEDIIGDKSTKEGEIIEQIVSLPKTLIEEKNKTEESPINSLIKNDTSKHVFTSPDFDNVSNSLVKVLPFTGMRSMKMASFGLDHAEGIVDLSKVKEGYVLYPSKSTETAEVYITLFLVEQNYQNKFVTELSTYLGSFESLRKGYIKTNGPYLTDLYSIGYKYSYTENEKKYETLILTMKSSNVVCFVYYLDSSGRFTYQKDLENAFKTVLDSYT